MKPLYFYDGRFYDAGEAAIPFTDRSVFFADAVYDACLVKNGRPYLLDAHLDRFYRSMGALRIKPKMERNELQTLLCKLCEKADCEIAFLYFQAARSAPLRRHFSTEADTSHLLVCVSEMSLPDRDRPLRLILANDHRYGFCHIKTTNLLPAVLASTKAVAMGADEAVFVREGMVTECAHSNISILKNGVLHTHPKGRRILPGIGREQLIKACKKLSIPVMERPFSVRELYDADEIFITSSSKLCLRANTVMNHDAGMKDEENAFRVLSSIFEEFDTW